MEHTKHTKLSAEVRDTILKLNDAGIKLSEIAEILNVSYSSAAYTIQCYRAVESDDWETLSRITGKQGHCVKWALEKLGKTLPVENTDEANDSENLDSKAEVEPNVLIMYENTINALNSIESLLSKILAELRG